MQRRPRVTYTLMMEGHRGEYSVNEPKIATVNGQPFVMGGVSTSGGTA